MSEAKRKPVALVTGGAQGIGRAITGALLQQGWQVMIADIDGEAGTECTHLFDTIGKLAFQVVDVAQEDQVRKLMQVTEEELGPISLLINNAGLANPFTGALEDLDLSTWQRYLDVNLTGTFLCSKHAATQLRSTRGSIINLASTRALQSEPDTEAYSASKGGVLALTHSLAMSLGPDVRVNSISPGWIEVGDWQKTSSRYQPFHSHEDHEQHPVGRIGKPDDVAGLVLWLASDLAGFVTGQNFVVDGGMSRKMVYQAD
ncbi:NAD(P)-dependent dehydrogenase, short-chain alcohol dehydrogenase family [Marinospirillum celere]|uniref:NAD(P)-dependent dehydrogenase, short-chain alcohol dehydrogenase family n=1 Tax=Marinospirillum celere TaxID=1122252 RepID=A0A1I1I4K3_9GAMM|nr:SDR family oxidoreductase [Marinospirillum celere]SFC30742.1 NAD(P)-dependent dehydrogenase, short-chain alcohol dehydrogenase family [Marinospirillum celere]